MDLHDHYQQEKMLNVCKYNKLEDIINAYVRNQIRYKLVTTSWLVSVIESENVATVQGNQAIFKYGTSEPKNYLAWYGQF